MEKMMQRKGKKKTMFLIAAVLAAVLVFSAFALSQKLSVQRYVLSTEKLGGPVRLAVVADLHSTLYGEGQEELIAAIRQESPDAVLFVGDIVDDGLSEEPVRFLFEALSPQYPCFYVSGNHEYWSGRYSAIKAMISSCGATVLEGEAAPLVINGQELCIARVPAQHAARNARAWLCARKLCHLFSSFRPFQLISSRRAVPGAVLPRFSPLPLAREDERFVCLSFAVPACAAFCRACAAFSAAAACLSA